MSLKIDDMSSQNQSYILGAIEIQGPTASEKRCSIFIDLAELFNAEYTSDAVEILKSKWKELGKKGKLDIDKESDYVSILTSKEAIVDLALLINEISPQNHEIDSSNIIEARKIIKGWKKPKPFPWEEQTSGRFLKPAWDRAISQAGNHSQKSLDAFSSPIEPASAPGHPGRRRWLPPFPGLSLPGHPMAWASLAPATSRTAWLFSGERRF